MGEGTGRTFQGGHWMRGIVLSVEILSFYSSAQLPDVVDLNVPPGSEAARVMRIYGDNPNDYLAGADHALAFGDVNGDSYADVIVGASSATPPGRANAGEVYVLYGSAAAGTGTVDLDDPAGTYGETRIVAADEVDSLGWSVASGDVNGDGYDDIVAGARGVDAPAGYSPGGAYVVFGGPDIPGTTIDLAAAPGAYGEVRIYGEHQDDCLGSSVGVGNIDGDAFEDIVLGAAWADPSGRMGAGEVYVLFGSALAGGAVIDLSSGAGSEGTARILGDLEDGVLGTSVASGDFDGDGYDEVIAGACTAGVSGREDAGAVYIVRGGPGLRGATVDLRAQAGQSGVTCIQGAADSQLGISVASGDVNGDGYDDAVMGANTYGYPGLSAAGEAVVFYGSPDWDGITADLAATPGLYGETRIAGHEIMAFSGYSVGADDVNGDALADVLVGVIWGDAPGGYNAGETFIMYGSPALPGTAVPLADGGDVRIEGDNAADWLGTASGAGGDCDRDGFGDCAGGALSGDNPGLPTNNGSGYAVVLFGDGDAPLATATEAFPAGATARRGFGGRLSPGVRAWLEFDDGDAGTASITMTRSKAGIGNLGDEAMTLVANAHWQLETGRAGWTGGQLVVEYLDSEFASINEDDLILCRAPALDGPWMRIDGSSLDTQRNRISAPIDRDGFYVVCSSNALWPTLDLDVPPGEEAYPVMRANGSALNEHLSSSMAFGDIDGDGYDDCVMSGGDHMYGAIVYIVYGRDNLTEESPYFQDPPGTYGETRILLVGALDNAPPALACGDVDGDSYDDIAISIFDYASSGGDIVLVLFGSRALRGGVLTLDDVPADDSACTLRSASDWFGVRTCADVNGDGIDDLLAHNGSFDFAGRTDAGAVFIVPGSAALRGASLNLDSLPSTYGGSRIVGDNARDHLGLARAGDVNGDGFDDIVAAGGGVLFVVPGGGALPVTIDLNAAAGTYGEMRVSNGGGYVNIADVDNDGYADVVSANSDASPLDRWQAGTAYVLYGQDTLPSAVDLSEPAGTFGEARVYGPWERAGLRVLTCADVTADGSADLVLRMESAYRACVIDGGTLSSVAPTDLAETWGILRIVNSEGGFNAGVGGADMNRDGLAEYAVAGYEHSNPSLYFGWQAGMAVTVFGTERPESTTVVGRFKAGVAPKRGFGGRLSPIARAWIAFDGGDAAAPATVTIRRSKDGLDGCTYGTPDDVADVVWTIESPRTGWTSAEVAVQYTDDEIDGLDERALTLIHAPALEGPWTPVVAPVLDTRRNTAAGWVNSLGYFALQTLPSLNIERAPSESSYDTFGYNVTNPTDSCPGQFVDFGDINGDGFDDLVQGVPAQGKVYVVYGTQTFPTGPLSFADPGPLPRTLVNCLYGGNTNIIGSSVACADVNADGFDDIIAAASPAGYSCRSRLVFVVYGGADRPGQTIDLNQSPANYGGTRIDCGYRDAEAVAAGDLNADGYADILIGVPLEGNCPGFACSRGMVCALAGTPALYGADVDFEEETYDSWHFHGPWSDSHFGARLDSGDFNGDGYDDIAAVSGGPYDTWAGETRVFFGGATFFSGGSSLGGCRILPSYAACDSYGAVVALDANADGLDDLLLGLRSYLSCSDPPLREGVFFPGESLVPGSTIDLADPPGTYGETRLETTEDFYKTGVGIAQTDLNADGFADFVLGSRWMLPDPWGEVQEFRAIAGQAEPFPPLLSAATTWGLLRLTAEPTEEYGQYYGPPHAAGGGDMNRDGCADLLTVTHVMDSPERDHSTVVFGRADTPDATAREYFVAGNAPRRGMGGRLSPVLRTWLSFEGGTTCLVTATVTRDDAALGTLEDGDLERTADVWWRVSTDRTGFADAEVTFQYTDGEIAGLDEGSLVLFRADAPDGTWRVVADQAFDRDRNTVRTNTTELGCFALRERPTVRLADPPGAESRPMTRIYGEAALDVLGGDRPQSIAFGDVNGDGHDDLVAGAARSDPDGRDGAGQVYVLYGDALTAGAALSLDAPAGTYGETRILGPHADAWAGASVACGDVDGDGYADVIVGAWQARTPANAIKGVVYVVYGGPALPGTVVDLASAPGTYGESRILGRTENDRAGYAVAAADIDADGIADVLVGAPYADPAGGNAAGEVYALPGSAALRNRIVDLADAPGTCGELRVLGDDALGELGSSIAAGDVDGDGYLDLLIGAPGAGGPVRANAGAVYAVYGGPTLSGVVDLNGGLGAYEETRILGGVTGNRAGTSVASADIDRNGYDDLMLGAPLGDPPGTTNGGIVYVLYGRSDLRGAIFDLASGPGAYGETRVWGRTEGGSLGSSVSASDTDADGYDDLVLGMPQATPYGIERAGQSVVVNGGTGLRGTVVSLGGDWGALRILGERAGDGFGNGLAGGADVDFDGFAEFAGSACWGDNPILGGDNDAGYAVLAFGLPGPISTSVRERFPEGRAGLRGMGGPLAPVLRARLGFDAGTSGEATVTITRSKENVRNLADRYGTKVADVVWELATDRQGWRRAPMTLEYLDEELGGLPEDKIRLYHAPTIEGPWAFQAVEDWNRDTNAITFAAAQCGFFALALPVLDPSLDPEAPVGRVFSGETVSTRSATGDLNDDGFDDIVMQIDSLAIVFGAPDALDGTINMATGGYPAQRIAEVDGLPDIVACGDINGDGLDDIVAGNPNADNAGMARTGGVCILFGRTDLPGMVIDLDSAPGSNGETRILGEVENGNLGMSVSCADFNGDGYDDVIAGAPGCCRLYVLFGSAEMPGQVLDLSDPPGSHGEVRVYGPAANYELGSALSTGGDFDGDGFPDVVATAQSEYVVLYGPTLVPGTILDLSATAGSCGETRLTAHGIWWDWDATVADFDADGRDDLGIGYWEENDPDCHSMLIYGSNIVPGATLALTDLAASGMNTTFAHSYTEEWGSVRGSDHNGDGLADPVIGVGSLPYGDGDWRSPGGLAIFHWNVGMKGARIVCGQPWPDLFVFATCADYVYFGEDYRSYWNSAQDCGDPDRDGLADLVAFAYDGYNPDDVDARGSALFVPGIRDTDEAVSVKRFPAGATARLGFGGRLSPTLRTWLRFADGAAGAATVTLTRSKAGIANFPWPAAFMADMIWQLETDRAGWTSAEIEFQYTDGEIAGLTEPDLKLFSAPALEGPWTEVATQCVNEHKNTVGGTVNAAGWFAVAEHDTTPPEIAIGPPSPSSTWQGPVTFLVTYTDANDVSLAPGDVTLDCTGDATASVSVSGAGIVLRTVTLYDIRGDGEIRIAIGPGTASDEWGNLAPAAGPSEPVFVSSAVPMPLSRLLVLTSIAAVLALAARTRRVSLLRRGSMDKRGRSLAPFEGL